MIPSSPSRLDDGLAVAAGDRRWTRGSGTLWLGLACAVAAGLLYYSLRGIDWREVWRLVRHASPTHLVAAGALMTGSLTLRAYRWRVLLNAEGAVTVPAVFWATAAGYLGNNFLPARAGELIRTFMISSRGKLSAAYVMATALSERIADAAVLAIVTGTVLAIAPIGAGWFADAARTFAVLAVIGSLVIAGLPLFSPAVRAAVAKIPLPARVRDRLTNAMDAGMKGVRAFHNLRRLSAFLGLTAVIWSVDALGSVLGAAALGLDMPFVVALLLVTGLSLGSALPSTPGYVGIYQFVAVTVLTPFGFSRTDAIAFILVAQALMYVVIGFWGSLALWRHRR